MSDSVALLEGDRSRHKCLEPKVLCPLLVSIGEMRKSPTPPPIPSEPWGGISFNSNGIQEHHAHADRLVEG